MLDQWLGDLWHKDETLTDGQMVCRAVLVFLLTIVLVRLAGRRSFGMRFPFDTVISLLLGAILSRGVVGASSLSGTGEACLALAILHRLVAYGCLRSRWLSQLMSGQAQVLYKNKQFFQKNMDQMLVSQQDVEEAVRLMSNEASLADIDQAYVERNGEISIIKKQST